jgi:hypothetical protein
MAEAIDKRSEHPRNPLRFRREVLIVGPWELPKIVCEKQMVVELVHRADGNAQEAR